MLVAKRNINKRTTPLESTDFRFACGNKEMGKRNANSVRGCYLMGSFGRLKRCNEKNNTSNDNNNKQKKQKEVQQ